MQPTCSLADRINRCLKNEVKRFVTDEVSLEYLLKGNNQNETIVFAHSLSSNIKQFFPHVDYFCKDYQVLCMSYRGHGNSSHPDQESGFAYTLPKFTQDLKQLIDHLGITSFHYVGNSFGGLIGYEFLKNHPAYLKSITTFGTVAELPFTKWTAKVFANYMCMLLSLCKFSLGRKMVADFIGKTPESRIFLYEEILNNVHLTSTYFTETNLCRESYLSVLENVKVPFLIIKAEYDSTISLLLKSTLKAASANQNIIVKCLKKSGHLANLDAPDEFNQILNDFLKNQY